MCARVRRAPFNGHLIGEDTFAAGLRLSAGDTRFGDQYRMRAVRVLTNHFEAAMRADFLIAGDDKANGALRRALAALHQQQCLRGHGNAGLHVVSAWPFHAIIEDAEWLFGQRADRVHGVKMRKDDDVVARAAAHIGYHVCAVTGCIDQIDFGAGRAQVSRNHICECAHLFDVATGRFQLDVFAHAREHAVTRRRTRLAQHLLDLVGHHLISPALR
jgi:hypothetical protein